MSRETLKFIRVLIEPEQLFRADGAVKIRITVDGKDGKVFEYQQLIEYSQFKSIGEEAFERCVGVVRHEMGWADKP